MTFDEFKARNMDSVDFEKYVVNNLWRKDFYVGIDMPGYKIRFHITTVNPYGKTWYTIACEEDTGNGFVEIDQWSDLELSYFRRCVAICYKHNIYTRFFGY